MNERSLLTAFAAIAFALAACDTPPPSNAGLDVPKVLQVERQQLDYEAAFQPGSAVLSPAEAARLDDFLANAAVRPQEHVYVAPAANDPLAAARVGRVVTILAQRQIGAERVEAPPAGVASNHLLLIVKHYIVQQPACPDWSGPSFGDHTNYPASNFGCANMTNLGMMVDDPRDLTIGRAMGPASAEPSLNAIERYRTDTVKPLPSNTSGGSGSGGGSGSSASASSGGASASAGTPAGQ
jgi:pilus assembly protein CpaD